MTSRRSTNDGNRRNARISDARRAASRRGSGQAGSLSASTEEDDLGLPGADVSSTWDEETSDEETSDKQTSDKQTSDKQTSDKQTSDGAPAGDHPTGTGGSDSGQFRGGERRQNRPSGFRATLRVLGAGLLIGGVTVLSAFGAYRYARTSPRFSVRQIEVDGLRRVTREALLAESGIRIGQNVFSVDTDAIGKKVLVDRWLQEVRVERRLPATVRITVVERDAGALAMMGDNLLVVTRVGEPFKRFENGDPTDLPVITGVSLDEPGREPAVEKRRIAVALEVLRHFERFAISRTYPPQEVHLTPGGEVVLIIGKTAISLYLGTGPWAKKLAMAERILTKLHGRKESPSMVFLDNRAHPERVVVRMK